MGKKSCPNCELRGDVDRPLVFEGRRIIGKWPHHIDITLQLIQASDAIRVQNKRELEFWVDNGHARYFIESLDPKLSTVTAVLMVGWVSQEDKGPYHDDYEPVGDLDTWLRRAREEGMKG